MKLVRYGRAGAERPGVIDHEGTLRDLSRVVKDLTPDVLSPAGLKRLRAANMSRLPVVRGRPRLGCPLTGIGKIVCIGLNYTDHALEVGLPLPAEPTLFIKANSAINGPNDPIVRPRGAVKLDYEVELGAVIGRDARNVSEADAMKHVAAYCIVDDFSERAFQMEHAGTTTKGKSASYVDEARALDHVAGYALHNDYSERCFQLERGGQWVKGKSCDTFAPIGPWLVTADEAGDPQGLEVWTTVNGESRQRGHTKNMVFGVAQLVAYVSRFMSLRAGDIISTGTPAGVAHGMKPPRYLQPGDVVEMGITGLGVQKNRVVEARA
jgi:2,4-diketo-3-deoxy-L-fuconate hydrolase